MQQAKRLYNLATLNSARVSTAASAAIVQTMKLAQLQPRVANDQLFSAAGQIYSDRRCSLPGENAEKLLFLAYNIRLFNYDY